MLQDRLVAVGGLVAVLVLAGLTVSGLWQHGMQKWARDLAAAPLDFADVCDQQAPRARGSGRVSFMLAQLNYVTRNGAVPPFWAVRDAGPSTVVDVGMFNGADYTVPALAAGHRVYAFEPALNKLEAFMSAHRDLGGRVKIIRPTPGEKVDKAEIAAHWAANVGPGVAAAVLINAGAGATTTTLRLKMPKNGKGMKVDSFVNEAVTRTDSVFVNVSVVRVDDVVDEDLYVLKSDAQGFDCHVIHGAERLLRTRRVDYVVFEFWPFMMDVSGCSALKLLQFLDELGYQCFDWITGNHAKFGRNGIVSSMAFEKYLEHFDQLASLWHENHAWTDMVCTRLF